MIQNILLLVMPTARILMATLHIYGGKVHMFELKERIKLSPKTFHIKQQKKILEATIPKQFSSMEIFLEEIFSSED